MCLPFGTRYMSTLSILCFVCSSLQSLYILKIVQHVCSIKLIYTHLSKQQFRKDFS